MKKILLVILLMMAVYSSSYAEVLIIANKNISEIFLTRQEIREIFLGKRVQWRDNSKIRFITSADEELHGMFLKQYMKISDADWKIHWKRMVFTGRGLPPEPLFTESEIIKFVSETKGGIGYISSERIQSEAEKERVKFITVRQEDSE